MSEPFFKSWKPDKVGLALGTGYMRFTTAIGIDGLAKRDGDGGIDLLAVATDTPGEGRFRAFIGLAKKEFSRIGIWEVWNPTLAAALKRYGFKPAKLMEFGEVSEGWQWTAKQ